MQIFFVAIIFWFGMGKNTEGMEIEAAVKMGSVGFSENGIQEGNKAIIAGEINVGHRFGFGNMEMSMEAWSSWEPLDEDKEIPEKVLRIGAKFSYEVGKVIPALGVDFYRLEREKPIKYADAWSDSHFFVLTPEVEFRYKFFYGKAGLAFPLIGGYGYRAEAGLRWKALRFGPFFDYMKVDEDRDFEIQRRGVLLGVRF